jgi:hypothetical protein
MLTPRAYCIYKDRESMPWFNLSSHTITNVEDEMEERGHNGTP